LKWIAESVGESRSDCGNYRVRGGYVDGNFWRAFEVATGRLIVASSDKEFVKWRCETHASNIGDDL
jgi:hypothetical protein